MTGGTVPLVRGRILPEIESTGRPKKILDVLLWIKEWKKQNWGDLHEVEILRDYLRRVVPSFCGIRVLVPNRHPSAR
jgi:hypothetical protein